MSISQPSKEIYVVDVPEIKRFSASYRYNFFVPDESVNETGGVPVNVLSRSGASIDSNFIQYSITRVPRLVQFSWTKPKLADVGKQVTDIGLRNNAFGTSGAQNGSLILNNIDKVVSEDDFSSNVYTSVHFHDGEIDTRINNLVSGTLLASTLEQQYDPNSSPYKAARRLVPLLPSSIAPHFVFRALTTPASTGTTFYTPPGSSGGASQGGGLALAKNSSRVLSEYFQRLKSVKTNAQINGKFIHDLVNRSMTDPTSAQALDLVNMHQYSKQAQQATNQRFSPSVSPQDYKSFVQYISVKQHSSAAHVEKYGSELVGYIIDKFVVLTDGSLRAEAPIIVDSPHVNLTADFQVKFNAVYCYTIRSVALLTMPAIDDDTGELATLKVLASSRPSNKVYVSTLKLDAPPPPADVDFVWNYQVDPKTNKPMGLLVTWAFPVTSERDIKRFQVFRRSSVNDSFELQKEYNFDDSVLPFPSPENPDPAVVERLVSPTTFWRDEEFDKDMNSSEQSGFIYSVCAIDAHAQTSGYSAQFLVWFDRFQNKLVKKLISHTGAPKPYPNMYLAGDLFANTIRVAGPHAQQMKLYFNPEYYYLYDDRNRYVRVLQTAQTGGAYKLQFLNLDNFRSQDIDIVIDDRSKITTKQLSYPSVSFGPKRASRPSQP